MNAKAKAKEETPTLDLRQFQTLIEAMAHEYGIPEEEMVQMFEKSVGEALRRHFMERKGHNIAVEVNLDQKSSDLVAYRVWRVLADEAQNVDISEAESEQAESYDPELHILLSEAKQKDENLEIDSLVREPLKISHSDMGRIVASNTGQFIKRYVREASREKVLSEYEERVGELVSGTIERRTRNGYEIKLRDNIKALLPYDEVIGEETFREDENVRAVLIRLDREARGFQPVLVLSRRRDNMLAELFRLEVPEVAEQVIEIKAVARSPGVRSKIAVKTNDGRIDPVGVCVGMRGTRVQAVMEQICDERVDIILWDDQLHKMAVNALAPAKIAGVYVDEARGVIEAAVAEESRAQALGKNGENVRLASKLIGWQLDIVKPEILQERRNTAITQQVQQLMDDLETSEEVATALQKAGMQGPADLVELEVAGLRELAPALSEQEAQQLLDKASEVFILATMADGAEEQASPEEEYDAALKNLPGMDNTLLALLSAVGIATLDSLADADADLLNEKLPLSRKQEDINQLVLSARQARGLQD